MIHVTVTPHIGAFIASPAHTKIVMGPRGEMKTTGSYYNLLYWASTVEDKSALPYRVIWVRDTWTNLQKTAIATLKEIQARDGLAVQFGDGEHEALIGNGLVQVFFVGMDHLKDLNKFQGFGAGALVIDEPAPAAVNDIGVGLPVEVYGVGATSLRQGGVPHRVVIPMNPPEEDHWTLQLPQVIAALKRRPEYRALTLAVEIFRIPRGENPWITDEDRLRWRATLEASGRGDLVSRLSEGRPGFVVQGEEAFPEYSEAIHVAPHPLQPMARMTVVRSYDFGLTPVCVFSQVTPAGHWLLLGAVAGENMDLDTLLTIHALPWLQHYLGNLREWTFRDIGGPEALVKDPLSGAEIMPTLLKVFGGSINYEAGPIGWADRLQPMKRALNRMIRGRGLVQVDPDAKLLRRMLRGGAHYPKDSNGQIVRTKAALKRVSGIHGDLLDACCHAAAILFPVQPPTPAPRRVKPPPSEHSWMSR